MAPGLRDLRRLADGAALVAREAANRCRSDLSSGNSSGGFESIVGRVLKSAVMAATDLAGLTKGTTRDISVPPPVNQSSVVYFDHDHSESGRVTEPTESDPIRTVTVVEGHEIANLKEIGYSDRNGEQTEPDPPSSQSETSRNGIVEINTEDVNGGGGSNMSVAPPTKSRRLRERRVPSTPLGRALGFAGLGAGLAWGTLQESAKRIFYGSPKSDGKQAVSSPLLTEQNAERLALALCRMRGAALKLGQMLSIQDESFVPAPILAALNIVRQGADVMPRSQLNAVLDAELGSDWALKLKSFDYEPLAAASIGQVHRAVLRDGLEVAMKIQYPGVANSIDSDIDNVRRLLDYTNIIPKGLFLDRAIKVAKEELSRECDYVLEAANQKRFRELLFNSEGFYVPKVIDDLSSRRVLTTELVAGVPIDEVALLNQETRDYVGRKLLELTLKELFVFQFMQTDPNWGNFLYDEPTRMINLIDFGAARQYPKSFVDNYLRMVVACANRDREAVIEMSRRLGFLTGEESDIMIDAHVQAGFIVGLPFSKPGGYDFRLNNITPSITSLGATMLKHRLTPPPDEAYSLHRKLSGAFLACIKLGAVVPCRELLFDVYKQYRFGEDAAEVFASSFS